MINQREQISLLPRKPLGQLTPQPNKCVIGASLQANPLGDTLVKCRRPRRIELLQRSLQCLLWSRRLLICFKGEILISQPISNRATCGPVNGLCNCIIRSPNPNIQFRLYYNCLSIAIPELPRNSE